MSAEPAARRLVLLRHGLTPWNAEGRMQGHADVGLSEIGHQQAKAAAEALRSYDAVLLVSSDLDRARTTAAHVAEATGLTPSYDPRLREIDAGSLSGHTTAELTEWLGPGPYDYLQHGGESRAAVAARVHLALGEVRDRLGPGETAIVVSHGLALRVGVSRYLGWPDDVASTLGSLANCAWAEVAESESPPDWRLVAYNRVAPIS